MIASASSRKKQPTLCADNLTLSSLHEVDATCIRQLAGDKEVAHMTESIPHPYPRGLAEEWIASVNDDFQKGDGVVFGIYHNNLRRLLGCCGLVINTKNNNASLGYWIGKDYWSKGYATIAAREVVRYGFEELGIHSIESEHLHINPASGRVMEKIGMLYQGTRHQAARRDDRYVNILSYYIINPKH